MDDRDLSIAALLGAAAGFAGYALWKSWSKTSFLVDTPHAWDSLTDTVQSFEVTPLTLVARLKRLEAAHPKPVEAAHSVLEPEALPESPDNEVDIERFRRMG